MSAAAEQPPQVFNVFCPGAGFAGCGVRGWPWQCCCRHGNNQPTTKPKGSAVAGSANGRFRSTAPLRRAPIRPARARDGHNIRSAWCLVTSTLADASSTAALVLLASAGARAAGVYVVRSGGGILEEAERTAIAAGTLCRAQKLGLNEIDRRQRISSATPA